MDAEFIRLVRNDTKPQLQLTLIDESTGGPIDLTGASVSFHMASTDPNDTDVLVREAVVPAPTAAQGVAILVWGEGDLDKDAGQYRAEVQVTFPSGNIQTVYDFLRIRIRDELA